MFETAELGRKVSKATFKRTAPVLRQELLELQDRLRRKRYARVKVLKTFCDRLAAAE